MFPVPEYLMALTQKYWGAPFLLSILLILVLVSMPFSLSSAVMGGCTCMIRHFGLAGGGWFVSFSGVGLPDLQLGVGLGL